MLSLLFALLAAAPALGQTLTASSICTKQCGAATSVVRQSPPDIQACLIRCNAGQQFDRFSTPGSVRPIPPLGVATYPGTALPSRESVPMVASAYGGSAGTARSAAAQAGSWGAAYLPPAPATHFGLSTGLADRFAAHMEAQRSCAAQGPGCRSVLEFSDRCGAVAQARRTLGMVQTSDPRSYAVSFAAAGSGPTQDAAEAAALSECTAHEHATKCRIAASACGRP